MFYTVKKTVLLIINSGNDYLIGLKENQLKLYKMAQTQSKQDTHFQLKAIIQKFFSYLRC